MALNINIRDVYRLGEPVSFWATIDPTDAPLTLPTSDPYQFCRDQKLIYQPRGRGGARHITADNPSTWDWDQKDQFRRAVGPGDYELVFFGPDARPYPFKISDSWKSAIKSSAKWCGRATKWGGLATAFFEPLTGAILAFVTVPFEWIEKDPPSKDFKELEQIPKINMRLDSISESVERDKVANAIKLTTYLIAVLRTVEKVAGAEEASEDHFVGLQESHLEFLMGDISKIARSLSREVAKTKMEAGRVDAKKAIDIIRGEIEKPFLKNLLNEYTKIVPSFAVDLAKMLQEAGRTDFYYLPTLNLLKLELGRFSNLIESPPAQAVA